MVAAKSSATGSSYETFTASSGLISSPNYPQTSPNTYKAYMIVAPSSATVKLQFLDFRVFAYESDGEIWGHQLVVCVTFLYINGKKRVSI